MRKFSSYGPIINTSNYYAPREEQIEKTYINLIGENPAEGGHYFTVWAPRQTGKTWIMQQVLHRLKKDPRFSTLKINLETLKDRDKVSDIINILARYIGEGVNKKFSGINSQDEFQEIFKNSVLDKPIILILDEFDALAEEGINTIVSAFRNIYIHRSDEFDKTTAQKTYLLHGVALIGVRSVLGIENEKGSPFNVQRSVHISNLTYEEMAGMFKWYEKESGQGVEEEVTRALYNELRGQPGLTCWFGELLTETYNHDPKKPITMSNFTEVYSAATHILPNNNILNLISKAREEENKTFIMKMFQTGEKQEFKFDDKTLNALYMNGLVDYEVENRTDYYVKFSCPFVQKRLFNYFSNEYFNDLGVLLDPFLKLSNIITPSHLDIIEILKIYQRYLDRNKNWLFKRAPRRSDQRLFEAIFHFNIYSYLHEFLRSKKVVVFPEFPTGNGKIDLVLQYENQVYGIELKSFRDEAAFQQALKKAAHYGKQLGLTEIFLVSFIETVDDETRAIFEKPYLDLDWQVTVKPFFIQTGVI
ncbi:MAG TPA: AAA-like domain-containing protein [Candidatus Deferrimicrobium sp.]|nr:AAA-like domain-containing protein [Candidatus Kapabacteria bacterium]HLP57561.1 AAA-like domain-containing protein [Candidatus Deferrimicrobium sp.]